jgi:hypothetical protein
MISKWKKNAKKPSFSRALSLKLPVFECKVENLFHQILKKLGFCSRLISVLRFDAYNITDNFSRKTCGNTEDLVHWILGFFLAFTKPDHPIAKRQPVLWELSW